MLPPAEPAAATGAEDPGPGLLDRQDIVAGDLELDLHGERFVGFRLVQVLEAMVDGKEVVVQQEQLIITHEALPRRHLIGGA